MTPQEQIDQLKREVSELRSFFMKGNFSGTQVFDKKIQFNSGITFKDATNIPLGTTTGLKLGTASTQKLGLYGATPVIRAIAISAPSGGVTVDAEARTAINSIRTVLINIGITA